MRETPAKPFQHPHPALPGINAECSALGGFPWESPRENAALWGLWLPHTPLALQPGLKGIIRAENEPKLVKVPVNCPAGTNRA